MRLVAPRVVAVATVVLYAAGMAAAEALEARLGLGSANLVEDWTVEIGFGAFAVVGALLLWKRPGHPVGWLISSAIWLLGVFVPAEAWAGYVMTTRGTPDALATFGAWGNAWYWMLLLSLLFAYLPLLFPDGHLPSPRWRPVAWLLTVSTVAVVVLGALTGTLTGQNVDYRIDNPVGVDSLAPVDELPVFTVFSAVFIAIQFAGVTAVGARFRSSSGAQRQQLKWFVAAVALFPLGLAGEALAGIPLVSDLLFGAAMVAVPTSIAIAVLRYRLYEIDRIVSRTLTYGVVTALLLGVYALVATLPGALFDLNSDLLVAAATLAAAAAFGRLRRRVQAAVDRRFNRSRYDAARVVERFGARLRREVDVAVLASDIRRVVAATVQPDQVSLWLRQEKGA